MIVSEKLVQEIDRLVTNESLVLCADKAVPRLLLEATEDVIVLRVEFDLVLVEVIKQVVGTEDLGDLDKLVGVALAVEEGLLAEDHGRKHGAQTPHVQAVVILLEIHQQFGPLEIPGSDANVVLSSGVVELSQTPVNETQLWDT